MRTYRYNCGFTLIELMVATSIFMMVMLAAIGALMITSNAAKESKALRSAMDNVNFAMDTMTRTLRLGSEFACMPGPIPAAGGSFIAASAPADCASPSGGSKIVFTKPNSTGHFDAGYQLASASGRQAVEKCDASGCASMTAPEVAITDLKFFVRGSDPSAAPIDGVQPSVEILLSGTVTLSGKVTTFALQSLASQRNFE
jgi:type II secretory pathway pseudopilin PulG